ncbi:hypothetical protein L873DRAFT_1793114 [Choiromyces venosus 120613-1]|uniref:Uncharacterized protein n=1 Tax=Choiromyces venosus 120613-1 TaxID=1336337 RepID=A0A3N4JB42_9PEZI|nr:hypothetical protein L873DRAFT_1793114 [Choiromyces venosus 120613-1]
MEKRETGKVTYLLKYYQKTGVSGTGVYIYRPDARKRETVSAKGHGDCTPGPDPTKERPPSEVQTHSLGPDPEVVTTSTMTTTTTTPIPEVEVEVRRNPREPVEAEEGEEEEDGDQPEPAEGKERNRTVDPSASFHPVKDDSEQNNLASPNDDSLDEAS